ncbi:MAG: hypothetical protein WC421_07900 [Elusimicrobiales bacterium]
MSIVGYIITGLRAAADRRPRGQTTVEYLLTTVALVITFAAMYRFFGWYLLGAFKGGARIVLTMYKQDPW